MLRIIAFHLLGIIGCLCITTTVYGQDPTRFSDQIDQLLAQERESSNPPVLFTGSSSVRIWDLGKYYPELHLLNHGFGGSQMSDLEYYLDQLVIQFSPSQVFIYEGDNDLAAGKSVKQIMKSCKRVVKRIQKALPECEIFLIAAKPSVARWQLAQEYENLNAAYLQFARRKSMVAFADVWTPMLDSDGMVMKDIFLQDNLHMNDKGYALWDKVIGPLIHQ
ncbi:MAG: hypothetical protein KTR24_03275 [Saprospiraceae bacterium]|nr:hypothetical protein [Saprospiraceae bacterium]